MDYKQLDLFTDLVEPEHETGMAHWADYELQIINQSALLLNQPDMEFNHDLFDKIMLHSNWALISCVQKAIRRGDKITATLAALAMYTKGEANYLIKRVCTTALEDIGVGNLSAVVETFAWLRNRKLHKKYKLETMTVIAYCINILCDGYKSRAADYINLWTNGGNEFDHVKAYFSTCHEDELLEAVTHEDEPIEIRALACRALSGQLMKNKRAVRSHSRIALIKALKTLGVDYRLLYLIQAGVKMGISPLYCNIALVVMFNEKAYEQREPVPDFSPLLNGLPSYAFDKHTQEGKKAYAYFSKTCSALGDYAHGYGLSPSKLIGDIAFLREGGVLDKYVDNNFINILESNASEALRKLNGVNLTDWADMKSLFDSNMNKLHNARAKIIGADSV